MGHKYANILETVGNTPVVKINKLAPPNINLFVKVRSGYLAFLRAFHAVTSTWICSVGGGRSLRSILQRSRRSAQFQTGPPLRRLPQRLPSCHEFLNDSRARHATVNVIPASIVRGFVEGLQLVLLHRRQSDAERSQFGGG
jgi:hypothetical protein